MQGAKLSVALNDVRKVHKRRGSVRMLDGDGCLDAGDWWDIDGR